MLKSKSLCSTEDQSGRKKPTKVIFGTTLKLFLLSFIDYLLFPWSCFSRAGPGLDCSTSFSTSCSTSCRYLCFCSAVTGSTVSTVISPCLPIITTVSHSSKMCPWFIVIVELLAGGVKFNYLGHHNSKWITLHVSFSHSYKTFWSLIPPSCAEKNNQTNLRCVRGNKNVSQTKLKKRKEKQHEKTTTSDSFWQLNKLKGSQKS